MYKRPLYKDTLILSKKICSVNETNISWQKMLYKRFQMKDQHTKEDFEDLRSADWKYYLPINENGTALIFGSGLGTVPFALGDRYKNLFVFDSDWEKIKLLRSRVKTQNSLFINTCLTSNLEDLPLEKRSFDLIVWSAGFTLEPSFTFDKVLKYISPFLKESGILCMTLPNYYSLIDRLSRQHQSPSNNAMKLTTYRSTLRDYAFDIIQVLSPLPYYKGIPLFYVPIDNSNCLNYFLKILATRFLGISPESRRFYRMEYFFVQIMILICRCLPIASIVKHFLPGYIIIARKKINNAP